eukprot:14841500-Alexandrium_andersonii.AAC.1
MRPARVIVGPTKGGDDRRGGWWIVQSCATQGGPAQPQRSRWTGAITAAAPWPQEGCPRR